jgi:Rrf2 family protein
MGFGSWSSSGVGPGATATPSRYRWPRSPRRRCCLVAKLRDAGLVGSVRGAHGGYHLARPASAISMRDVVEALEGPVAPMECFHTEREGRVLCSHEIDDGACATKLLWTRVHAGVTKALANTSLAELVEFAAERRSAGGPLAVA